MRHKILLFARVRELFGVSELQLELKQEATAADLVVALKDLCPELDELSGRLFVAKDQELVEPETPISDAQELAIFPPVGGG